jgi:voltage-gated potassium channel
MDTIEYNLEQLDDLSFEELELLKETTGSLIQPMDRLEKRITCSAHWCRSGPQYLTFF